MAHAILYRYQSSGTCAGMCTCDDMHEMEKTVIGNQNITVNIFRTQVYDLIVCGYFCTGFTEIMVDNKSLPEFTSHFTTKQF